MSLFKTFTSTTRLSLKESMGKSNIHQVPQIDKIVITMGVGSLATRKGVKDFSELESELAAISAQKPHMILSRKSVSNFKLREGMPAMLKSTLRGKKAYDFIQRLVVLTLPRVRDFSGVSRKKFDGNGNYSLGFSSQSVFAEIVPENIKHSMGVQITIVTTADTDNDAKALLESLGIIFDKKIAAA